MFTKKDIFQLKLAMERDGELSHGAARLGLLVCSYIYNDEQLKFRPHEPFPLPWTLASKLCFGMSQRQVYRCEWELVHRGYFIFEAHGDRNTSHFRLALHKFSSAKNGNSSCDKNGSTRADKFGVASSANCDGASSAKKGSPLTKLIPSEEIAKANEGRNGSLRSEKRGELTAATPQKELTDAKRAEHAQALSQLRLEIAGNGKTKTKAGKLLKKK